jgi:hypothetical protein
MLSDSGMAALSIAVCNRPHGNAYFTCAGAWFIREVREAAGERLTAASIPSGYKYNSDESTIQSIRGPVSQKGQIGAVLQSLREEAAAPVPLPLRASGY